MNEIGVVSMGAVAWSQIKGVSYEILSLDDLSDLLDSGCDAAQRLNGPAEFDLHQVQIEGNHHLLICPGGNFAILTPSRA